MAAPLLLAPSEEDAADEEEESPEVLFSLADLPLEDLSAEDFSLEAEDFSAAAAAVSR